MSSNRDNRQSGPESRSAKTLRKGFSFFGITCVVAACGYVIAGWDWLDAIYMVTITIFGVGYGEVRPIVGPWLKIFTMGVIFAGCSSLVYVIGGIVQMLTEGEIERMLGTRTREKEIDSLVDHTIICGYGRIGQLLANELALQQRQLVVIDRDPERVEKAVGDGFLAIEGDAADDETLNRAGVYRARTLATVLPNDAVNVFITLTARGMSDSLQIIARAEFTPTEAKLIRAGASHIVMPAAIGAMKIAQLAETGSSQEALPENRYRMLQSKSRVADVSTEQSQSGEVVGSTESESDDIVVQTISDATLEPESEIHREVGQLNSAASSAADDGSRITSQPLDR